MGYMTEEQKKARARQKRTGKTYKECIDEIRKKTKRIADRKKKT